MHSRRPSLAVFIVPVVLVTASLLVSPAALADDFLPPPWRLGPNPTVQGWEFLDGNPVKVADDPGVPQVWGNGPVPFFVPVPPFGPSTPVPLATVNENMVWDPGPDGDGGWSAPLGAGFITLWIPNVVDNEFVKLLRIQLTFTGPVPDVVDPVLGGFGNDPNNTVPGVLIGSGLVDANHYFEDWQIQPNPHWDRIGLAFEAGSRIDQIVVDTISFPEPTAAAAALLAASGLTLPRRRRR